MEGALARAVADLGAWLRLAPLLTEYLPFPDRALRPAALAALLDEVLVGNRTVLLELGSGPSSVVLARLLARRGFGRLLSIEHDERWAAFVNLQLRREGLHHLVRVVHAPLAPHPAGLDGLPWYAPTLVRDEVTAYVERFGLVDLLLVDGPDRAEASTADAALLRFPAMPVLRGAMAPGASVLADDAEASADVLSRWAEEYGTTFRRNPATGLAHCVLAPG
ncbi:class I SAM-dependent methyltransferase [Streptoalloteichus hindustanus]|uniref:Methyltransferase domain-containing protein n=1 Tax=Streptoalloteichus hindustanus TaxID=2017 RepID=A0A1M4VK88_STRHI|nr:class I SAM-dependent methyltransferase [Streptoalloteichus hindustanus]SHE69325.1 Methyltransferase domain-containing protein [Streptoalloteichus hindustanus]